MNSELRPVGTRFTITYPPDRFSSAPAFRVYTYEVIGYRRTPRFPGDESGETAELIEPVVDAPVLSIPARFRTEITDAGLIIYYDQFELIPEGAGAG